MSQESFEKLCTEVRRYIQKNKTTFQDPISVEKQVAALYYLADEGRMRKVENSFGIGKSAVSKMIRHATQAISKYLGSKYIVLPTNEKDIEEMASSFYNSHGFPQCICAVDGTHVGDHLTQLTLSIGKEDTHSIFRQQQITTTVTTTV